MKASLSVQAIQSIQDSYSYTHTYMYTEGNYNKILFKNWNNKNKKKWNGGRFYEDKKKRRRLDLNYKNEIK